MNLTHDGLTLWFGTPDTPGPFDEEVVARVGASLIVGVHPASPLNSLLVRYRVDKGITQTVPGRELRCDYERARQYFTISFPPFVTGDLVEYWPILTCGGRQVPAPQHLDRSHCRFRLAPKRPQLSAAKTRTSRDR